jgi:hypothetical protein
MTFLALTATMKRCGAGAAGSEEYGNPSGVRISRPMAIRNNPLSILRILSGFLTNKMRGTYKKNMQMLSKSANVSKKHVTSIFRPSKKPALQSVGLLEG